MLTQRLSSLRAASSVATRSRAVAAMSTQSGGGGGGGGGSGGGDSSGGGRKCLLTKEEGVHQTMNLSKSWRNKPLFRRQGDVRFKTGLEAAELLVGEAKRRDAHEKFFIESVQSTLQCLSPVFDRNPRYAFVAKQLMEPERFVQFRVAWIDDVGVTRMTRGYRAQYSSTLGPYEGALAFGSDVNAANVKAMGFDAVFSNALTGFNIGAAAGGADVNPYDKSEAEMQRFCQSYMTELAKYVGPGRDVPTMGKGVGEAEIGYLYGQYKRIENRSTSGGNSEPFLSGGLQKANGFGVVHFADNMMRDKGDSLKGKKCLILGSGKIARSVAEKLLEFGAVPLSFSDQSGFVYEPNGIDKGKLRTINNIKSERGSLLGRYIISSTSARFNDPESIFDIPCDLCFPCGEYGSVDDDAVAKLADGGCAGVVEGGHCTVTPAARDCLKRRGLLYGPHTLTMTGSHVVACLAGRGDGGLDGPEATDAALAREVARIYGDVKRTATDFNARGDLFVGANITGFLRVANVMLTHGAV